MSNHKKKILFIINPFSGVGRQKIAENAIAAHLNHDKFDTEIRYTEYAHHATEIARNAVGEGFDVVVAVGGDGSINDVVAGLVHSDVTLGIIPCGSGNGLARHLQIPLDVPKAIEVINNFNCQKVDTINLNDRVYASIAGIGFDALVARLFKNRKIRGLKAYTSIVINQYPTYKTRNYKLTIDGEEIEREALFVSFANSNQFGYNTKVAPTAELNDGLIDVCVVNKIPFFHIPLTAPLLYTQNFEKSQHVEIFKAKEIKVHNNDYRWVNLDGEAVRLGKELEFRINPLSLNIITKKHL
ncbi:diacylglycerol kinase family lipid kinase [Bacteroidales bacterium OttesenSCG-928-C19]|nr:diacylglycerol kinase family lipid kinase [Bacteroidales bacterium OttesenSCG-928-C19]